MSMGSKVHGPSAPSIKGKSSRHPKFAKKRRPARAKSPRNVAPIVAGGIDGRNGSNSTADPTIGTHGDTRNVRRPARNTMRNSRMGGGTTFPSPKAEDLVGRDIVNAGATVTAPFVTRVSYTRKPTPSVAIAKAEGEAENLRQIAMAERSARITLGIPDGIAIEDW